MRTVEAGNHTKPTQLNPLCTELITIITATTTYPEKHKLGNFQNGGIFFILDIVSTGDFCRIGCFGN